MKFLIFISLLFSQFALAQQEVGQRTAALAKVRADIEGLVDRPSFSDDDHRIIKTYFSSLSSLESDLGMYDKYRRRFNSAVRTSGTETFCGTVLLDIARYNSLVKNCTKNGYFLCSDEVMTFVETKKKISEKLETDLKIEFEKLDKCK